MHPIVFRLACLALLAGVLALMVQESEAVGEKVYECCKKVSTLKINITISGFRFQRKDPPCVKAVIFKTTEGEQCVYWRLAWVMAKVKELRAANKNSTNASPTTL
uniref:Uncharacterized LOC115548874 n=1 Tax=Gadus morhua TaxID=8049 RepID=A0A8C5AES6_GADMO